MKKKMTPEQFELLIRISERQKMMYELLINHLQHHLMYTIALFTVMLGLGTVVVKMWLRNKALTTKLER